MAVESTAHPRPGEASWQESLLLGTFAPGSRDVLSVCRLHIANGGGLMSAITIPIGRRSIAESARAGLEMGEREYRSG